MPRGARKPATTELADSDPEQLPSCDGSNLNLAQWLCDLEANQHLLDTDVVYFLVTATAIASNCKTAVLSKEHSRLLLKGQIQTQGYSVLNPPPIEDSFARTYAQIRNNINNGSIPGSLADFPAPPPDIPDNHLIAPDRIMQIDMKLRNTLLSLIESRGRRQAYAKVTLSGCALLRRFQRRDRRASSRL